jgi:glycosyltransferase involved in cell wall biosynthesis
MPAGGREVMKHAAARNFPIVYFGNDWFAENRTSSHHIARRLGEKYPLLYVESPGFRSPKANARDLRKLWRKLWKATNLPRPIGPRMWHMTMPQIPFRRLPGVGWANRAASRMMLRRALRHLGFESPVLWFVVPHTAAMVGCLDERFVVYYCIDDYASLPDIDQEGIRRMDDFLARSAQQVFVSSPALLAPKQRQNPHTVYSPHGVDVELFARALDPDLPVAEGARALRHPVIGFTGLTEAWVDLELLAFLAKSRPDWTILMIGRVAVDVEELKRLPNVVFAGTQPYETLPQWSKAFDVAIIPFVQNELVRNVNPLKLREYLATGKPVVSVWMPEVEKFADCVAIARTKEEFLRAIEEALAGDSPARQAARQRAVAGMTWDARVEEVLRIVHERMAGVEEKNELCPKA